MNMFTKGQRDRMLASLNTTRSGLLASIGCTPVTGAPSPAFTVDRTEICPDGVVTFSDQSTGGATSLTWNFPGGTPSSSTAANPTVTYTNPGTYDVFLTATNAGGSNQVTMSNYITVDNSGAASPYTYDFGNGGVTPTGWSIDNADGGVTWASTTATGPLGLSTTVAYLNNFGYNNPGTEDKLVTEAIDLSGLAEPIINIRCSLCGIPMLLLMIN